MQLYNDVGSLEAALDDTVLPQMSLTRGVAKLGVHKKECDCTARPADMGNSSSVHSTLVQIRIN